MGRTDGRRRLQYPLRLFKERGIKRRGTRPDSLASGSEFKVNYCHWKKSLI